MLLLGVSVWQLAASAWEWLDYVHIVLGTICVVLFIWLMVKAIRSVGTTPTEMMPGAWQGGYPATLNGHPRWYRLWQWLTKLKRKLLRASS
jgi:hypothetical protein